MHTGTESSCLREVENTALVLSVPSTSEKTSNAEEKRTVEEGRAQFPPDAWCVDKK